MDFGKIFEDYKKPEENDTIKVSYYVINYCKEKNINLTNLKLLKLLYFINIQYMNNSGGEPIFKEEFLAWRHGPVLQTVYDRFKFGIITPSIDKVKEVIVYLGEDKINAMDKVLTEKASKNAWELVEETHEIGGPWDTVFHNSKTVDNMCFSTISHSSIYNHYRVE